MNEVIIMCIFIFQRSGLSDVRRKYTPHIFRKKTNYLLFLSNKSLHYLQRIKVNF
jgi:hypothetical protein